jgi:uncharacterized iron-regulated protein
VSTISTERRAIRLLRALLLAGLTAAAGCAAGPHAAAPPTAESAPEAAAKPAPKAAPEPAPDTDAAVQADEAAFPGDAESPYRDLSGIPAGTIVHVPTGSELTLQQMMDVVGDARIIYVGEMHNNLADHDAQLAVITELERRHPGEVMVGMEMFERDAQPGLDQWLAGDMDAADFLTLWYRNWSEYYGYYARILDYVRDHHIPLVALNATKEEVHNVSQGMAETPGDWREEDPYHKAYLDGILGGHVHGGGEHFHAVQKLWEETMAQQAYEALTAPQGQGKRLVVLAGAGHIQYGFGIPRRLFERLPVSYATIVLIPKDLPADRPDLQMETEEPELPLPLAEFVWADRFRDLEEVRIKLGVQILPDEGGMRVLDVMPGSAAEWAGVKKNDLLVSLDDRPLADMVGVQVALTLALPGGNGRLVVERDGERLTLEVPYAPGGVMRVNARVQGHEGP